MVLEIICLWEIDDFKKQDGLVLATTTSQFILECFY